MALLKDKEDSDFRAKIGGIASRPLPAAIERIAADDRPTILIAGLGERSQALVSWSERAGLRSVGRIGLDEIADRLGRMCSLDLVLLDLRGPETTGKLDRVSARALIARHGLGETQLAVIVDIDGLDCALAMLDAPQVDFLCEPADSEIVSLLVMAGLRQTMRDKNVILHDTARETETMRLEQLSEEVRRLAATIERMTMGGLAPFPVDGGLRDRRDGYRTDRDEAAADPGQMFQPRARHRSAEPAGAPPTAAEIRAMIRARRMRDQYLPADLFADPAWDMILDLMAARLTGQRVSVSSLCIAASVPPTTALRWIRQLTDRAVFARIDDPADGRRVFIELTEMAAQAVSDWVQAVRRNGLILAAAAR